mgnify:CR=1 FL=1
MKNVLLLCMSPLSPKARINKYSYESQNDSNEYIAGVMTNEAPTKAVIRMLVEKGDNNRLDKVVMICSDAVHKPIKLIEGENDLHDLKQVEIDQCLNDSHIDFYKRLIDLYAKDVSSDYVNHPIEYETVGIADFTEDDEVSKSVIEAAGKVATAGEHVNLFIDFNGGQRYVAFMILAIANLMKIRHVNIDQIMTMNFDNKVNGIVPIQNMEPVFASFDLISGINEYINYGRIKTLRNYFKSSNNKDIKSILAKMEEFSNNLQLCRTGYVMDHRGELLRMLDEYSKQSDKTETLDTYEQLFAYVVSDILEGYEGLLTGELPDIIRWCVNNDFIQQALTFTSEEMPGYFWKSGLLKASPLEKQEYDNFLKKVHAASMKEYSVIKRIYRKEHPENSSKYAYEWMINYLPYSSNERQNRDYQSLLSDSHASFKRLVFTGPKSKDVNMTKNRLGQFVRINLKGIRISNDSLEKAKGFAAPLIWHTKQRMGRASCGMRDKLLFNEVMVLYFLLKEQRNLTNHADGETEEADLWTYEQLCHALEQMIKNI